MSKGTLLYAQSGGVTAVINATASAVIQAARGRKVKVLAARNGILGALREDLVDTSKESPAAIRALAHTPGGAFGSRPFLLSPEARMSVLMLLAAIAVLAVAAFFLARQRALASTQGNPRLLHSLPGYYGWNAAMFTMIPALAVMIVWLLAQPVLIERGISAMISADRIPEGSSQSLVMSDLRRVAEGLDNAVVTGRLTPDQAANIGNEGANMRSALADVGVALGNDITPEVMAAAQEYRAKNVSGTRALAAIAVVLALAGLGYAVLQTKADFRARNTVEAGIKGLLVLASVIAIATTAGIVFSMLFEANNFFRQYSWTEFFFGTEWSPNFRGNSQLGMLPLLWGTLYVSFIALVVAVTVAAGMPNNGTKMLCLAP